MHLIVFYRLVVLMIDGKELGNISNIQRFSVHDGTGIRTVVFLKGCPLRCQWCQNPEARTEKGCLIHVPARCISCFTCISACKATAIKMQENHIQISAEKCIYCGECVKTCPAGAITASGQMMTVSDVFNRVLRDEPFYKTSGGGVTLSGGEPLQSFSFSLALLSKLKDAKIHTAIETCGYAPWENLLEIAKVTDLFLYDLKHTNADTHKYYTGVGNELIVNNLLKLASFHKNIVVRVPLIPGVNDQEENLRQTAKIVVDAGIHELHILPFHQFGRQKWKAIGEKYLFDNFSSPDTCSINRAAEVMRAEGLNVSIGGSGL